jgi:hypothetical protein
MFKKKRLDKSINVLEGYLNINDIIYQEEEIKKRFDELDSELGELLAKNMAGIKGYEKYTPQYVYIKRIELLERLFVEYPSFDIWSGRLKVYLMQNDRKIFEQANMTMGRNPKRLSPTEILLNEESARKALVNMRVTQQSNITYKR